MFKLLANLFKRKIQQPKSTPSSKSICSISFEVNKDGSINILCDWPEFHIDNAKSIRSISHFYASAIHALNNGLLAPEIIGTLNNYDRTNEFNGLFVHNTLVELSNIEQYKQKDNFQLNKPVISPLSVFRSS